MCNATSNVERLRKSRAGYFASLHMQGVNAGKDFVKHAEWKELELIYSTCDEDLLELEIDLSRYPADCVESEDFRYGFFQGVIEDFEEIRKQLNDNEPEELSAIVKTATAESESQSTEVE
jgi:hypothetical protein